MFETVAVPLWALILILGLAAISALERVIGPTARWFLRRRMERVVAKLNERLERPIEPFKLARRHDMIQRLIYDPEIAKAIAEHASEEGVPENVAFEQAQRYAREIVPSFSATAYFGFAIKAARWLSRALYRVRLGAYNAEAISKISPDATVVFVMNHRSNMDYVLVTYLAAERSALSYAVGEWARVWPLSRLIKSMGAFFIRRRSRNALYRRVLARYVKLATAGGVTQAVFPEGGLSLDGKIAQPKLGLLNYMVSDFDPDGRDVVFVPVALNYDRVLEDRVLIAAAEKGERKFRASIPTAIGFVLRQIGKRLRGTFYRFGYAAVSFGEPLSLAAFSANRKGDATAAVGAELKRRIAAVVPVLPVPLVASALIDLDGPADRATLEAMAEERLKALKESGAHIHVPREDVKYAVETGLRMFKLRHVVDERDGQFSIVERQRKLVAFYANSIRHLIDAAAAQKTSKRHKISK